MAQTTVTEFFARPCSRCGGAGFISAFQHRKGGECFRCGASGRDPVMVEKTRPMTDDEVVAALAGFGFEVVNLTARPETGDFLTDLFLTDEEAAAQSLAMTGARALLSAI